MTRIRERGKWLVALALCLSCFVLCATLMSAPTRAAEPPPKTHEAVAAFKNVYERLNAAGLSQTPKQYVYASGTAPAQVYNAVLKETEGKFSIGIDGYTTAPAIRYFPIKANGTLDTKDPAPPAVPPEDLPVLGVIAGRTNIYEQCDKDGNSLSPKKYVYACSDKAEDELVLPATKNGSKYYLRLAGDVYIAVAADGTLDCNDVIEKLGAASEKVLYPLPAPVYKYKAVDDYKNLFEVLGADGKSKSPKEYLYSTKAPEDGKEPPAQSQQAFAKGEIFYVCFLDGSGIFVAADKDGTLNYGKALWWGLDGEFGTKDDLETSVREDAGYFYWQQAQGVWQMIKGIFNPAHTTTTTTTTAPVYKYAAVESRQNIYELLGADGKSKSPREYIYSEIAPVDGSAPPARARTAYVKGDYFYAPLVEDSGIFLAVNSDGTLNYSAALWWGLDRKFGTADDIETSVKEENGYYWWRQLDGLWQKIENILVPEPTNTTSNDWLTTTGEDLPPKTGKEATPAAAVCLALLLMGCAYCGYQAFRRRTIKTH